MIRLQHGGVRHNPGSLLDRGCALFLIIQAASGPVWPLLACLAAVLALVIRRFASVKTKKIAPPKTLGEAMTVSRIGPPAANRLPVARHQAVIAVMVAAQPQGLTPLTFVTQSAEPAASR